MLKLKFRNLLVIKSTILLLLISGNLLAQLDKNALTDLHPVSPTAFQFEKYTEMPVSEYTGIPGISIPFYNIKVDEVTIPLKLTYHGGGIRVSEEASWVGLGWDLQVGSIIQTINDREDLANDIIYTNQPNVRTLPDYFNSNGDGSPALLPMVNLPPRAGVHGYNWTNPYPINNVQLSQGYAIATDSYVPVNGDFQTRQYDMFNTSYYDSEPDIFSASFLGESLKFIVDFSSPSNVQFLALNKRSYVIHKTTNGFEIINPAGTKFYFEYKSVIKNYTNSTDCGSTSGSINIEPSVNVFFLSKIVTVQGKIITLNYTSTDYNASYPTYSQVLDILTEGVNATEYTDTYGGGNEGGYIFAHSNSCSGLGTHASSTYSQNWENYTYLSSITFPTGTVAFQLSGRNDITGAKKLDGMTLSNFNNETIRKWQLDYSYFNSSAVTGNGYNDVQGGSLSSQNRSYQRLQLLDVKEADGGTYSFTYDPVLLPYKNSFAQDYWGFYNGKTTNVSFMPNPAALNHSEYGSNNNDRNSSLSYARASTLTEIQYPTGGKVKFEYELNEFDKSQAQDIPVSGSTIQGCGIRIHKITKYDNSSSQPSLITTYSYAGGKLINELQLIRSFFFRSINSYDLTFVHSTSYTRVNISANGVFTSNPLQSVNGVGYDEVTKEELDGASNSLGKTVTTFSNHINLHNPNIANRVQYCSLPSIKSLSFPENGSVLTQKVYNSLNNTTPISTTENTYDVVSSSIYYGARIFPYGQLHWFYDNQGTLEHYYMNRNLIGYYPIADIETLLATSQTTEVDQNGNNLVTKESYSNDALGQCVMHMQYTTNNGWIESNYLYPYNSLSDPNYLGLYTARRLNEVIKTVRTKRPPTYEPSMRWYEIQNEYATINGHLVKNKITELKAPSLNTDPEITTINKYDANANPLEYTEKGMVHSMIWDASGTYVVAEAINAGNNDIAFSSFEDANKGNWNNYTGSVSTVTSTPFPPTGKRYYNLTPSALLSKAVVSGNKYKVSYWSKNGVYTINGGTATYFTGKSINGWTFYEHSVTATSNTISISGSGAIDEVRLYPANAQMITYTYKPLVGMISQCDASNRISYYEYDNLQRLWLIRDEEGHILKKICYNYSGQTESCNCTTYEPDWQNTATAVRCKKDANNKNTGEQEREQKDMNPCSLTYNQLRWIVIGTNLTSCPLPLNCNSSNCSGVDQKCVNDVCETGIKVYTGSHREGPYWFCDYHYEFSDGSWSGDYSEEVPPQTECTDTDK